MNTSKFGGLGKAVEAARAAADPSAPNEGKRRGRPPGKKSDTANYRQVTIYLPIELHDRGKRVLWRRRDLDFSELVAEALKAHPEIQNSKEISDV